MGLLIDLLGDGGGGSHLPAATEPSLAYYFDYTATTDARPDWDGPVVWVDVNSVGTPVNWITGDYLQDSVGDPASLATVATTGDYADLLNTPDPSDYAPSAQTINNQAGTTYTLVLADAGKVVRCANASPVTLTIPPNGSVAFPTGTRVDITQSGAGVLTVAAGSGVTINKPATLTLALAEQWSQATVVKVAADTWDLAGDLAAV